MPAVHPQLAGINGRDELLCVAQHKMQPLPRLPATAADNVLKCDLCLKEFTRNGKDYGCAECNADFCFECIKHLPGTAARAAPRHMWQLSLIHI